MLKNDNIRAFAANSAYFFILSFIPLIMLLMSLLHYTNISQEYIFEAAANFIPASMFEMLSDILDEVYSKSAASVSISALITLWSAGKGFMALKNGMHEAVHIEKKKSYLFLRFSGAVDTLVFMIIIIMALTLGVFGQGLENMVEKKIEVSGRLLDIVVQFRKFIMLAVFIAIFTASYKILPDWKDSEKYKTKRIKITDMLPGAAVSAVGWHLYSAAFSIYLHYSKGFVNMYGSLAALIGIMLWLYGCMYLVLAGLEINIYFMDMLDRLKK